MNRRSARELWLAVDAGSVMEDDDQKGLAHLLEHMLFNGTKRFPSAALLDFLEGIGMKFGPEINAYTSFDETVYNLQVPTAKVEDLAKAFDVLQDWAGAVTLAPADIDKERGIIVEEWRLRDKSAAGRMQEKIVPMLLGKSRYAERLPIGDMEVIRNAPAETVRRFYEQWYRPDLMAVVAVGDFDVDQVEKMIQERFSKLTPPAGQPLARPSYDVPAQPGTRTLVVKDPEFPVTVLSVFQSRPARSLETVGDYRDLLIDYLVTIMLNGRYAELAQQADAPFLGASADSDTLVRPVDSYELSAQVKDEKILEGLEALLTEFERAQRHGFVATEADRAKQDILRFYESAYKERDTSESDRYANEYVDLFLKKTASPGIAYEYDLVQRLLPGITLDEINKRIANLVTADNRAIFVQAPDKADLKLPAESELTAVVDAVQAKGDRAIQRSGGERQTDRAETGACGHRQREDDPRSRRHRDHPRQRRARHHEADRLQDGRGALLGHQPRRQLAGDRRGLPRGGGRVLLDRQQRRGRSERDGAHQAVVRQARQRVAGDRRAEGGLRRERIAR